MILNSYHEGYKWTDDITRGIKSVLENKRRYIKLYIEYMDTKRYSDEAYFQKLYEIYKYKFSKIKFDVILSSDDNAFHFLRKYRDEIFPGTPVIFCGVNFFEESKLTGYPLFTGVNEEVDLKSCIEIALRLHPDTKQVAVINDRTTTGIRIHEKIMEVIPGYKDRVRFILLENVEMVEIQEKMQRLPPGSVVLYTLFFKDRSGRFFEYDESISLVAEKCNVPIYGVWDFSLGFGIVGGKLASGYYQGETAGKMALQILDGEKPGNIPVVKESPNRYMFDFKQMQRFGIKPSALPEGSIVINKPRLFFSRYKNYVIGIAGSIMILLIIILCLIINIKKRNEIQKALRESEGKYRDLVERANDGIIVIQDEKIKFSNKKMAEMLGYSQKELNNMNFIHLIQNQQRELILNFYKKRISGEKIKPIYESQFLKKDKRIIDVEINAGVLNVDGKPADFIFVRDITEKKIIEAERQKHQEQLIQADKLAALGTLVSCVAHEINNPNNAIMLNSPLLYDAWKDTLPILEEYHKEYPGFLLAGIPFPEVRDYVFELVSEINNCSGRIKNIVEDLRNFARPDEFEMAERVDINKVVQASINLLSNLIKKSTDHFRVDYGAGLPLIKGNFQKLEQVVVNLIQNSCQALRDKKEGISIYTKYFSSEKYIEIKVIDEGVGIKPEHMNQVMNPFFTTKRDQSGTGLGLSVSMRLIKKHNGSISFESKEGEGTTAIVRVPVQNVIK